jgi:ABC-2 type transport system ATP-binding protein
MNIIQLENVSKSYGKNKALDNLSLQIREGEIYGFIGPNGAGKSTTIRLILNFLKSDSGKITVFGLDPLSDEIEIKKQTGYVSSETFMYPDMKVKDIFAFTSAYYKVDAREKTKELIDALDIDIHKRFEELSFGNRKKVSIACAMLHSPKLIILDEPSNGLDPVIRTNLYSLLKEEQSRGTTIFFSSHVLGEVRKVSTRIGLLKEGQLIKEVSAEEFTKTGYCKVNIESSNISAIKTLDGVAATEQHGNHLSFIYSGKPDALLRTLSGMSIDSVLIEEPDPETVFMHYFQH